MTTDKVNASRTSVLRVSQ